MLSLILNVKHIILYFANFCGIILNMRIRSKSQVVISVSMTPADVKVLERVRRLLAQTEGGSPSQSSIFRRGLMLLAAQVTNGRNA